MKNSGHSYGEKKDTKWVNQQKYHKQLLLLLLLYKNML